MFIYYHILVSYYHDHKLWCNILNRIAKTCDQHPTCTALRGTDSRSLTYAQLDAAANRFAWLLRHRHGVQDGVLVGLHVHRSIDMVVAMIGIMRAGGGFVPIDPSYPKARIEYMLDQSEARLVVTERALLGSIDLGGRQTMLLDDLASTLAEVNPDSASQIARPWSELNEIVAYVIFTSGTTGQPKGVLVPHRAVSAFLDGMIDRPGLQYADRLLTNASISFDMTIYEIFLPLAVGAEAVITSRDVAGDGDRLVEALERFQISSMIATPATWRLILSAGWAGNRKFKAVCGGEAFPRDLANELLEKCGSVWNIYGPTETTVICLVEAVRPGSEPVLLGFPTRRSELHIIDADGRKVPEGETGELLIGGPQVTLGYLKAPDLTAAKFIANPFNRTQAAPILYKSGDLVRMRVDGNLEYLGRIDHQVKIRGYRIELGEVSAALARWAEIKYCHVTVREDRPGDKRLVAYIILMTEQPRLSITPLRTHLREFLPDYMIPHHFVVVDAFPMTVNGKVDHAALPNPLSKRSDLDDPEVAPRDAIEQSLSAVFADVLQFDRLGINDDFFAMGLNSLLATMAAVKIRGLGLHVTPAMIYELASIAKLRGSFTTTAEGAGPTPLASPSAAPLEAHHERSADRLDRQIAIIGMAGRFPGAENIDEFWHLLINGNSAITNFGVDGLSPRVPQSLADHPQYVPARGILKDAETFDAKFFGITPIDAAMIDPQQRIFLQECWHALENGGYAPQSFDGQIGVFGGMHRSTYLMEMMQTNPAAIERYGDFNTMIATEKDYVATRVAHRLNLTGPAVSVHTACSTSAVATIMAVNALRDGQCDMALAGGASITFPQRSGHLFQEGGIQSPDGACKPFAADANGTVFSDGVGAILLKRLADAERDGDHIYALIHGVGINNDGRSKASFLAPSAPGQRACIEQALDDANLSPHALTHVEAHGTGTVIGDPIETSALRAALTKGGVVADVRISSIKGNFGHMTAAAGVASMIKTSLAIKHRLIPASLHAHSLNSDCGFDERFRVNAELAPWGKQGEVVYAGVSSFGVGGTNAHIVLGSYDKPAPSLTTTQLVALLPISARSEASLAESMIQYQDAWKHLSSPSQRLAAACTLQTGRQHWEQRAFIIAGLHAANAATSAVLGDKVKVPAIPPQLCWMFPGQGTQSVGMAASWYSNFPAFQAALDQSMAYVLRKHGVNLRPLLLGSCEDVEANSMLSRPEVVQPAIVAHSLALADLWTSLGLRPTRVIGHSIGEFAAAVTAGIMDAETALDLVTIRGQLTASTSSGSMLAIRTGINNLTLPDTLSLAAHNGPSQIVVSGPNAAIESLHAELLAGHITCTRLSTSHAFHSSLMQPVVEGLARFLATANLSPPKISMVSTVTGKELQPAEARSAAYWSNHARATVRFADAAAAVKQQANAYLEIGPKGTLSGLMRQNGVQDNLITSASASGNLDLDEVQFLKAIGRLWQLGCKISWQAMAPISLLRKQPMPGYVFDRTRHSVLPTP